MPEEISPEIDADRGEQSVLTRRALMMAAGVAGITVAGVATAGAAAAATPAAAAPTAALDAVPGAIPRDIVAVIHDVSSGVVDLYFDERHVRVSNRQLAALMAGAAR